MHQRKSFPDIRRAALKRHKGRLFKVEQRRKFIRNLQFVYVNSSPEQLLVFPHKSWPRQFMFTHFIHSPIYLAFELCAINNQHPTKIIKRARTNIFALISIPKYSSFQEGGKNLQIRDHRVWKSDRNFLSSCSASAPHFTCFHSGRLQTFPQAPTALLQLQNTNIKCKMQQQNTKQKAQVS